MTPQPHDITARPGFGHRKGRQMDSTFSAVVPTLPGCGLPQDRHARIAARRAFVDLKQQFMAAVDVLDGLRAERLRYQVRQVQQPGDLWLLRGAVFAALGLNDDTTRRTRDALQAMLDRAFPDNGELLPLMRLG